jgi:hypothetical protein
MRPWHALAAAGLVLALAVSASAAPKVKKHQLHAVRGVVESVHRDTGAIVIRVHHHHPAQAPKPGQPAAARVAPALHPQHHRHTVHVNADTRFEKIVHTARGAVKHEPASFRDVHKGEHVLVVATTAKHHHARAVDILVGPRQQPKAVARVPLPRRKKGKGL